MNNENTVDSFLNEVNSGNNDFPENQESFIVEETPVEEKVEEVEEEKSVPFHKDPKVMRFVEKQIKKALEEHKPSEEQTFRKETQEEDDYYIRLIGNDTPEKIAMIKEAKARDEKLLQQAEERALNRLTQQQREALEKEKQAEEQLDNALENIEENYNVDLTSNNPVARKTRVDFMKFVEKIAPKDSNGEIIDFPDMNSAFETFQEMRKTSPQSSVAKDLASRSMVRSGQASAKPQERITFDNMDSIIERMFKK